MKAREGCVVRGHLKIFHFPFGVLKNVNPGHSFGGFLADFLPDPCKCLATSAQRPGLVRYYGVYLGKTDQSPTRARWLTICFFASLEH